MRDRDIAAMVAASDVYLRRLAKTDLVGKYSIDSYRHSDVFFAAMRILIDELEVEDVVAMYAESQRNNQAIGWPAFKDDLEEARPGLLGNAMEIAYGDLPGGRRESPKGDTESS